MTLNSGILYSPSAVQQEFHLCNVRECCFAGSAGPGKTTAEIWDPIISQVVVEHDRWERGEIKASTGWAIHFRRSYPMLKQTLEKARTWFNQIDPGVTWSQDDMMFTFSCGYKYQFGHMQKDKDYEIYIGNDYTAIYFDEAVQFTREQYDYLSARCRSADPVLRPLLRIRCATNPAPGWVKQYFVDPAPEGRKIIQTEIRCEDGTIEKRGRIFIPALLKDNPDGEFRRDYEITLRKLPAHIRLAWLNGRWDVIAGAFFAEEFIPEIHVVENFPIPEGWTKFRSLDWGYKSWCVVTWWAVDTDGNLICYREYNCKMKDAEQVALEIREIENANHEWNVEKDCSKLSGPADWQIQEERGTLGPSIAEIMAEVGVYWERCTKDRHSAAMELMRRLKMLPKKGDTYDRAGISWMDKCVKSIQTIPTLATDPCDMEVPEKGGEDHWLDSAFYAVMYRAAIPKHDKLPGRRRMGDDLEEARKKRTQRTGKYGYGSF